MTERNWGVIAGVIGMFMTFGVAVLAGVSIDTAFMRGLIGAGVAGFIGFGFQYLGNASRPKLERNLKGRRLDVTVDEPTSPGAPEAPKEFHPLDIINMARVVQQEVDKG